MDTMNLPPHLVFQTPGGAQPNQQGNRPQPLATQETAAEISIAAEAFVVDVVPQFPEDSPGLDLGDVRVGATVEKTFQVVNNGSLGCSWWVHWVGCGRLGCPS